MKKFKSTTSLTPDRLRTCDIFFLHIMHNNMDTKYTMKINRNKVFASSINLDKSVICHRV